MAKTPHEHAARRWYDDKPMMTALVSVFQHADNAFKHFLQGIDDTPQNHALGRM